jgi:hypothetical protein
MPFIRVYCIYYFNVSSPASVISPSGLLMPEIKRSGI